MSEENGIGMLENESSESYHQNPAVSFSRLKVFDKRAALYQRTYLTKEIAREPSEALVTGAAIHAFILEGPAVFSALYAEVPEDAPRKPTQAQRNAIKKSPAALNSIEFWDDFNLENVNREIVEAGFMKKLERIGAAIMANAFAVELLTAPGVRFEVPFRTAPIRGLGVGVQCKADVYNPIGCERSAGVSYLADLKKTRDLDLFTKQYYDLGYYRQAAWYRNVINTVSAIENSPACKPAERAFFIAFEDVEPFGCTVFEADGMSIAEGMRENNQSLEDMRNCVRSGIWPTSKESGVAGLPEWRMRQIMAQEATK